MSTSLHQPDNALKKFFLKNEFIKVSIETIDTKYGYNVTRLISRHTFNDPFNCEIQSDPEQVEHFNKLLGTSDSSIKWSIPIDTGLEIDLNLDNKEYIVSEMASNIYLLLSAQLFDNLMELIKGYLASNKREALQILKEFYDNFKNEISLLDFRRVNYTDEPTILIMQNLRLFRNRIIHGKANKENITKEFEIYNKKIELNSEQNYYPFKDLGNIRFVKYFYDFNSEGNLCLNENNLIKLIDLYSQLGYLCYKSFCLKYNVSPVL